MFAELGLSYSMIEKAPFRNFVKKLRTALEAPKGKGALKPVKTVYEKRFSQLLWKASSNVCLIADSWVKRGTSLETCAVVKRDEGKIFSVIIELCDAKGSSDELAKTLESCIRKLRESCMRNRHG